MTSEPFTTGLALLALAILMLSSVLVSRFSGRAGIPGALLFIALGMLAGSDGIGGIFFEDYALTFRIGSVALALILFDGGLNTPLRAVREGLAPASVLATFGVVFTAAIMALAAWLLGLDPMTSLLLGSIVASTDAAAVFGVLRGSGIQLRRRLGATLELESGLNDPMAVLLTISVTTALVTDAPLGWSLLVQVPLQLGVGGIVGIAVGYGGAFVLARARLSAGGLYPALTLALGFLSFGAATVAFGSGFLSVYITGVILGDRDIPYRAGLLRTHDALAWISQILMFLLLGLLATPSRILSVAPMGLVLALVLAMVARPLSVLLCLLPFRFPWRERLYISWVGLRGAVPIILATFPVMSGVPGALPIFDVVFFIVVVNTLVPGSTVRWVTRRLQLFGNQPPTPAAVVEISALARLQVKQLAFYIDENSAVAHVDIADLSLPPGATVVLIVRGTELVPPRGHTSLEPGDHVYVVTRPEDEGLVQLMFGQRHDL